jgi:type I restriction enzyme S subunit
MQELAIQIALHHRENLRSIGELGKELGYGGEWEITNFENAPLEIIDGDRGSNYPTQSEFSNKGYCLFLNAGNVTKSGFDFTNCEFISLEKDRLLRKGKLARNDVVLTTRGTVGNSAFFNDSVTFDNIRINSGMVILRAKQPDLDPRYLYLFVKSELFHSQVTALRTGSAQPQLPIRDIYRIKILIPPLPEQRAIAHILGTLDDKIELNRRMSQTLEEMARAIFKSWFVDFDPVRAKMDGRWRRGVGANHDSPLQPGLPAHLYDLFPDRLVDSDLGEIPEGWTVGMLGDIAGLLGGYAFKSKDWIEEGIPVVKIGSIKPGIVDLAQVSYVSREVAKQAAHYQLFEGDLVIGMTGYVGEVGLVPPTDNPPLLNQRVGKFILENKGVQSISFVYCLTRRPEFKTAVEMKAHGTAQANISAQGILSVTIVVPPKVVRDSFDNTCAPMFQKLLANYQESCTLAALRDALLPKLISGEIRVKDAERFLKERGL